jgi:hypothetical protein
VPALAAPHPAQHVHLLQVLAHGHAAAALDALVEVDRDGCTAVLLLLLLLLLLLQPKAGLWRRQVVVGVLVSHDVWRLGQRGGLQGGTWCGSASQ